jgi:hypothetical protein
MKSLTTRLDLIYRCCGLSSAISKEGYEQRLMLSSRSQISEVSSIRLLSILTSGRSKLDLDRDTNDDHRRANLIERHHGGPSRFEQVTHIVDPVG